MTNETQPTVTTTVRPEDLQAAHELAEEATTTTDVATLREMLADQNGGSTEIKAADGSTVEVASVGQEKFAELGHKATEAALNNLPPSAESWHTEEK